jgi:hypothetical protein
MVHVNKVAAAVAGSLAAAAITGVSSAFAAGSSVSSVSANSKCTPLRVVEKYKFDPNAGTRSDSAGAGTVTVYEDSHGQRIETHAPPVSWRPKTATKAELDFYHLDGPIGVRAKRKLNADASAYRRWMTDVRLCELPPRNNANQPVTVNVTSTAGQAYSHNWSGMEAYSDTYQDVAATVSVPTERKYCEHSSSHLMWVGIGGDSLHGTYNHLIQNGVANGGNVHTAGVNQPYLWYETIGKYHDTHIKLESKNVSVGDTVDLETAWEPSAGDAAFSWSNETNGTWFLATEHAPNAYGGANAEAIDERETYNDQLLLLRRFGVTQWADAKAYSTSHPDGMGLSAYSHDAVTMDLTRSGTTHYLSTPTGDSKTDFHDTWNRCGYYSSHN